MSESEILRRDYEEMIALHKRMSPEERLVAYFNHSRFLYQIYQVGVNYRSHLSPSAREKTSEKS